MGEAAPWQVGGNKDPELCYHWQEVQAAFFFTPSFFLSDRKPHLCQEWVGSVTPWEARLESHTFPLFSLVAFTYASQRSGGGGGAGEEHLQQSNNLEAK